MLVSILFLTHFSRSCDSSHIYQSFKLSVTGGKNHSIDDKMKKVVLDKGRQNIFILGRKVNM